MTSTRSTYNCGMGLDANKDGFVTEDELKSLWEAR